MTYHIHTEARDNLASLISQHFDAFTLSEATGYWRGQSEPSAIIEIATDDLSAVRKLAADIKAANSQESVLIESYATQKELV